MSTEQDTTNMLQHIAHRTCIGLHADSVILLPYENQKFLPALAVYGELFYPETESIIKLIRRNGLADSILKTGNVYLEDDSRYTRFIREQSIVRQQGSSQDEDFWYREKIKSSAFLRLDTGTEYVGVMLINYRSKQVFNESIKELSESFALLAAFAIANDRLLEQNRAFWESRRRESFMLTISDIVTGLVHNSGNLLSELGAQFLRLERHLARSEGKGFERREITELVARMRRPLDELITDFGRLKEYEKLEEIRAEDCQLEEVIDSALSMLRSKLEMKRITIKKSYDRTPPAFCDRHLIEHVLLNLFINALDAMGNRGLLYVHTKLHANGKFIRVQITDTGIGIPHNHHSKIFESFFTTKPRGVGTGLPVSRYIVERHGGRISFESEPGKGASFFIDLPVG